MEQNKEEKPKIIFPENTSDLIFRLVKRYRLEKQGETILDRLKKNKKISAWEIVTLIREIKDEKLDEKDLSTELQTRLDINKKKADDLVEDIKTNFFMAKEKESLITQQTQSKKNSKKDIYRELVE